MTERVAAKLANSQKLAAAEQLSQELQLRTTRLQNFFFLLATFTAFRIGDQYSQGKKNAEAIISLLPRD